MHEAVYGDLLDHLRSAHGLNDFSKAMRGDTVLEKGYKEMLGDRALEFIVQLAEIVARVLHRAGLGCHAHVLEDIWHEVLGLEEPLPRRLKVLLRYRQITVARKG